MKGHSTYSSVTRNRGLVELHGYFDFNGSSNPATIVGVGVTSVTEAADGKYTMTLSDPYKRLLYADFSPALATPLPLAKCIDGDATDVTTAGGGTIVFWLWDTTADPTVAVAPAAATGNRCFFHIVCQDYSGSAP